jgi:hypothetical protein
MNGKHGSVEPKPRMNIHINIHSVRHCTPFCGCVWMQPLNLAIGGCAVVELLRMNDPVKLSFLEALLRDGGVESFVLDQHMSVLEGSASAIPRRLMVCNEDAARARIILGEAGEFDGVA